MADCLEGLLVLQSRTAQGRAASSAHVSPFRELRSHFQKSQRARTQRRWLQNHRNYQTRNVAKQPLKNNKMKYHGNTVI